MTISFTSVWIIVGLAIMWITPYSLVMDLENRRGIRGRWMSIVAFFIPVLALLFIPILLLRKPDEGAVRKRLEAAKPSPLAKLAGSGPRGAEIGPEQIAKATSLKPWLWTFLVFAVAWPIVWVVVLNLVQN